MTISFFIKFPLFYQLVRYLQFPFRFVSVQNWKNILREIFITGFQSFKWFNNRTKHFLSLSFLNYTLIRVSFNNKFSYQHFTFLIRLFLYNNKYLRIVILFLLNLIVIQCLEFLYGNFICILWLLYPSTDSLFVIRYQIVNNYLFMVKDYWKINEKRVIDYKVRK